MGALLNIFLDGSVSLYVGGVEMGQGLHTKVMQIAAHELGSPMSKIYMPESATDKNPIPNMTGGSSACDFSGAAVKSACTVGWNGFWEPRQPICACPLWS